MISVEEARNRILTHFKPVAGEIVPLPQAFGRVLAKDAIAQLTQPPHAVSSMDGYALALDGFNPQRNYNLVVEIPAGAPTNAILAQGECARIYTGGFMPKGADIVIIQENAKQKDNQVQFQDNPKLGQWIRPAGMDFTQGQVILAANQRVGARQIGVMASANLPWLEVRRQPNVTILTSGDELILPGQSLKNGQIINSNGFALQAMLTLAGAKSQLLPIANDQEESLIALAKDAIKGSDLVLASGGASVGKHDLMQSALKKIGLEVDFWKIAMRPGKPLIFGNFEQTPFIGFPGNPVSVAVCFLLFAWPALMKLQGLSVSNHVPLLEAIAASPLPENDQRESFWRARTLIDHKGQRHITAFDEQDSAQQVKMAGADCLIRRAPFAKAVKIGEAIDIVEFPASFLQY